MILFDFADELAPEEVAHDHILTGVYPFFDCQSASHPDK
jgi:hypothetical protein